MRRLALFLLLLGLPAAEPNLPAEDGDASALARQVTIRRDTYGVPHILAQTEEAAALGWAMPRRKTTAWRLPGASSARAAKKRNILEQAWKAISA